jgi:predicted Zn finger-like uncharacterized protein
MPTQINCPSCSRALRVPDDLLGKNVKCPTCGTTFVAGAEAPPEEEPAPQRPARAPAPPPDEDDEEPQDEERRPRRRRRREYTQPHRGTLILVLGILSLVVFQPLGIAAWIMGNNDLKEIRAGRMDPEGEGLTNAGRICGIIGTIIAILQLLCCLIYVGFIIVVLIGAAANSH